MVCSFYGTSTYHYNRASRRKKTKKAPKINFTPDVKIPSSIQPTIPEKTIRDVTSEIVKEDLKEALKQERKLTNLIEQSVKPLFSCKSIFPFDLFPDEISVEISQINIRKNSFFFTSHLLTIPIENISDIHVQTSPFFATVTFIDRSFVDSSIQIRYLSITEAQYLRKIIQGLVMAFKQQVDVGKIERATLLKQMEELGDMQSLELKL